MDLTQTIQIRSAAQADVPVLWAMAEKMRHSKAIGYFEQNLEQQEAGSRILFIATVEGQAAGYCILNWQPKYGFFKSRGIPETQDLNVLPAFRRRGIGTAMIRHCEDMARKNGHQVMGISVGLDASFGPAQVLYAKLGYGPDGLGVTYDRRTVSSGEFRPVDDNLCLMLVKSLHKSE